jgi:hypothetical protein
VDPGSYPENLTIVGRHSPRLVDPGRATSIRRIGEITVTRARSSVAGVVTASE